MPGPLLAYPRVRTARDCRGTLIIAEEGTIRCFANQEVL